MPPIATLRDDFADNATATAWTAATLGSATAAETSGQARFTLPSSTAGTHLARYTSHSTYDLTGGSFYINIDTMVATGVAATAFFQLYFGSGNVLRWNQVSGTLTAVSIVAGVSTDRYTVAWNATTYKYLRIRESGGNIEWHSSSNGTSWTLRATLATPFAITELSVDFGANCGNIASPGSFRLEDVNIILPALTTNWRWQQAVWPLTERIRNTTIAIDAAGTAQGYLVTADGIDANGDPSGNVRYFSGPADGGRLLTEQASQAAAEAMAVDLPLDGRFDLATMVEGRCFRLYDRSVDGAAYTIREFYPRRLVQADDIEAESIRALHIAAGSITADRLTVTELSAITANIGGLVINTDGYLWQGTGSATSPTTGLKIYNSGGVGKLSTYNSGVEQVTLDTDGALKAAAGKVVIDENGISFLASISSFDPDRAGSRFVASIGADAYAATWGLYTSSTAYSFNLGTLNSGGTPRAYIQVGRSGGTDYVEVSDTLYALSGVDITGGLAVDSIGEVNVGAGTGAATGQVRGSGYLMTEGAGALPAWAVLAMGYDTATPRGLLVSIDNGTYQRLDIEAVDLRLKYQTTNRIQINSTGIGAFNVAPVGRQSIGAAAPAGGTGTAAGGWDTAANRNAAITLLNNIRTALIALGWCQT